MGLASRSASVSNRRVSGISARKKRGSGQEEEWLPAGAAPAAPAVADPSSIQHKHNALTPSVRQSVSKKAALHSPLSRHGQRRAASGDMTRPREREREGSGGQRLHAYNTHATVSHTIMYNMCCKTVCQVTVFPASSAAHPLTTEFGNTRTRGTRD